VGGTTTREGSSDEAAEACRQVAELLGFQSVDTVSGSDVPVEDVLDGKVDGLIVFRSDRPGQNEPARSSAAQRFGAATATEAAGSTATGPVRAIDAIRAALLVEGATLCSVLAAIASALGASEVAHVRDRGARVEISASSFDEPAPASERVRALLARHSGSGRLTEAEAHSLAAALGMRWARAAAAACRAEGGAEMLLVGWTGVPLVTPAEVQIVARSVGIASDLLDARRDIVDRALRAERVRWAGEIHDGLTQAVTGAYLELKTLRRRIAQDPDAAVASLDDVMHDVRRSISQIRALLFDLADDVDERATDTIEDYVAGIAARWQLPVRSSVEIDADDVLPALRPPINMVIREAVANAAKHADAGKIEVRLRRDVDDIVLEVEDDGRGFDPATAVEMPGHFGLRLLRERVATAGGSVAVRSEPGKGTVVVARLSRRAGA
jgi:signal transduction histidine kinase